MGGLFLRMCVVTCGGVGEAGDPRQDGTARVAEHVLLTLRRKMAM